MSMQYGFKVRFSDHIMEDNIGQLICTDVILARDGTYEYTSDDVFGDGKFNIVELHREWEEVKKLKHTLEGKPVVYYHPDKSIDIDMTNIDEFRIGHAQNIREGKSEGYNVLIGDLFITKPDVIEKIKKGELREISLGYFYNVDDSNKNHLKQVDMMAEHIAIVTAGRAGIAKILDAADTYILAKIRPKGDASFLEYRDEKPTVAVHKWLTLQKYGYYRFNSFIEFDQATRITLRTIGFIVKENPTSSFVVLNENSEVVKAYYHGKSIDVIALIDKGYDLDQFKMQDSEDPYDIPDEEKVSSQEETRDKDVLSLAVKLEEQLRKADKDFRHFGDNYRGTAWLAFANLLKDNKILVESILGTRLPTDLYAGENLHIAESFVRFSKGFGRKAMDENILSALIVIFDKEKSDLSITFSLEDLKSLLSKHKKKLPAYDDIEDLMTKLNEIQGVYAVSLYDFSPKILVSKAISDDEVEVYVCEDVKELNQQLTEYFKDLDEAHLKINTKEGKYSTMSALRI